MKEAGAVQRETLENLNEGVAVFGSDGRLKLFNPVYARLWRNWTQACYARNRIFPRSSTKPVYYTSHPTTWETGRTRRGASIAI